MDERIDAISRELPRFVSVFTAAERFSGPSLHFHKRAIDMRRKLGSAPNAVASREFLELVYATLTAWGMHRTGPGNTKLRELDEIAASVGEHMDVLQQLGGLRISTLPERQVASCSAMTWQLVGSLKVSVADARIVANSKLLHHLQPDLIPPMDRTYTFNVFYDRQMPSISEEAAWAEMYAGFHRIAKQNGEHLAGLIDSGWNSSETKILDNAIMGYAIENLDVRAITQQG
jgi:hypothetical protein